MNTVPSVADYCRTILNFKEMLGTNQLVGAARAVTDPKDMPANRRIWRTEAVQLLEAALKKAEESAEHPQCGRGWAEEE